MTNEERAAALAAIDEAILAEETALKSLDKARAALMAKDTDSADVVREAIWRLKNEALPR
jgi:hypothetical protein